MSKPRPADYTDRPRTPELERELVRKMGLLTEQERFDFLGELLTGRPALALNLFSRCMRERRYFLAILDRSLREADASTIRDWLECVMPRLGLRRVVRHLERRAASNPTAVEHARYWLPSFEGMPGYSRAAATAMPESEGELRTLTQLNARRISEADRQRLLTLWREILGIKPVKTRTLRDVRDDAGCPVMEPEAEAAFDEAMRRHDALNEAMRRDWAEHVD